MNRHKAAGCIFFGMACGIFRTAFYWFSPKPMTVSEVVLEQSFAWFYPMTAMLLELSFQYAPFLMFQILFGGELSEHFYRSGIFWFSRQVRRSRWFFQECRNMAGYCAVYMVSYLSVCLAAAGIAGGLIPDRAGFYMTVYFLCMMILWLYFHCLLRELISIFRGQVMGFAAAAILQYGYIFLYFFCQPMNRLDGGNPSEIPGWLPTLVWGNPFSHLLICWHRSSYEPLQELIDSYGIGIDLRVSLLFFAGACLVLSGVGSLMIHRKDIL